MLGGGTSIECLGRSCSAATSPGNLWKVTRSSADLQRAQVCAFGFRRGCWDGQEVEFLETPFPLLKINMSTEKGPFQKDMNHLPTINSHGILVSFRGSKMALLGRDLLENITFKVPWLACFWLSTSKTSWVHVGFRHCFSRFDVCSYLVALGG